MQIFRIAALALALSLPIAQTNAQDIIIHITGPGVTAKYVKQGDAEQLPVNVTIGQKVRFANDVGTTTTHNATERDPANPTRPPIFLTNDLAIGAHTDIVFDQAKFEAAGGVAGGSVELNYVCTRHPSSMRSKLILRDAPPAGPRTGVKMRRDITALSPTELDSYRDAWRRIQNNGEFQQIAGFHGCPGFFCHQDNLIFLPWHREFVLRLETALGTPVHYWDWTASTAPATGIPRAFTVPTYQSADGNTYPNPLLAARFVCPPGSGTQTTFRNPQPSSFLEQYAIEVRSAYLGATYNAVNADLRSPPHNNIHGWVGGMMGAVTNAAYDPIFWAHHCNVDRQWASWQVGGGPNPEANVLAMPLPGFAGRTVNDVRTISSLNYEYDRYDPMPTSPPIALRSGDPRGTLTDGAARSTAGVGKTFDIPADTSPRLADSGPLNLYIRGMSDHPAESYFVYVFVNQPEATPKDATPDNPNFAGTFGVFGGGRPAGDRRAEHNQPEEKRAMQLFAGKRQAAGRRAISKVTLVVTDPTGAIVARDIIPFDGVSLRAAGVQRDGGAADGAASGQTFAGTSKQESYDEAYREAVNKAHTALTGGGADRTIKIRVISVEGQRGGIAGLRQLTVTIIAALE